MRRVRSTGNRSTERRLRAALVSRGISGWEMHAADLPGTPDFVFRSASLAVFVDGCFWHGCPRCDRRLPATNSEYWARKIQGNRRRARLVARALNRRGFGTLRIWEHELHRERLSSVVDRLSFRVGGPKRPSGGSRRR